MMNENIISHTNTTLFSCVLKKYKIASNDTVQQRKYII